ncbi:MAG: TauD/TfdA family dioxygenase [Burkholderiaceae bacterium]
MQIQYREIPSAWTVADLERDQSWRIRLSEEDLTEIDSALSESKRRGAQVPGLTRADFPLPRLAGKLERLLSELETGRGLSLVHGLDINRYSPQEAATIFWGIGTYLGRAVAQNAYGEALGHVRSLDKDWTKDMSTRGYQTTRHLPFHNDSCDLVGLLCLQTAKEGGRSSIISSVSIFNKLARDRPDLLEVCRAPFFFDRRNEQPEGEDPYYPMPLFCDHDGRMFNRYNRTYIESAQRFAELPRLTETQREALDVIDGICSDPAFRYDMVLERGDMQFVNNFVALHSRTDYEDYPEPERKRHLLRLWLLTAGLSNRPQPYERLFRTYDQWTLNPKPPIFDFARIANIQNH